MMDPNDIEAALGKKRRQDDDLTPGTGDEDEGSENEHQTSKSRGAVTVQIFIKKTYTMINDCDPKIASWTPEGDKFVIKDPDMFAHKVVPQYFDHNKFSSFTREQSKAIKKSDNSSEIAKHQTFYHKYFQRGRPDLLKHLQRSRKTNVHDDDANHPSSAKKLKMVTSGSLGGSDASALEDLVRRVTESEMTIKNLQQENATLSFATQKLQQQDEMKQRALVALEEHVRVMEVQITQALQQQQNQIQTINNPLPFSRESSLSAVNPSTLMRYLSMNPGLNTGLQRQLTPLGQFGAAGAAGKDSSLQRQLTPLGQFSAAAAAENLVQQQQANEKNIRSISPHGPTLSRHPRMKGPGGLGGSASSTSGGGGNEMATLTRHPRMKGSGGLSGGDSRNSPTPASGGGPDLPRHMKMKGAAVKRSATAAAVAVHMDALSDSAAPTLRRHPRMKGAAEINAGGHQNKNANMLNRGAFHDNSLSRMGDTSVNGMESKPGGLKTELLQRQSMAEGNESVAGRANPPPTPNNMTQNGFNNGSSQVPGFQSQRACSSSGPSSGAPFTPGHRSVSPKAENSLRGPASASGISERELSAIGSLGGNILGTCSLGGLGAGSLSLGASGLGGSGLGASGLGTSSLGASGLGTPRLGVSGLGASGVGTPGFAAAGLNASGLGASGLGSGIGPPGIGATGLGATGLGAAGLGAGLGGASHLGGAVGLSAAAEQEMNNVGTDVTREESFSIASLLEMARGSTQQI